MKLTEQQARDVWDVLVRTCGADTVSSGHGWESFSRYVMGDHPWHEFRFCGSLGFGGKLHINGGMRVSCYAEDATPERRRKIRLANERLAVLWESFQ